MSAPTRRLPRRDFGKAALAALLAARRATARDAAPRPEAVAVRAVTRGPAHHFVGYYDKCPWNATGRYLAVHQSAFADRQPVPGEAVRIGLVDRRDGDRFLPLDATTAWSWQQGAMLQWLGSAPDRLLIYNTFDGEDYRATIRDVESGRVRTIGRPVYAVSADGTQAISLPFDRLNRLRPGYGYMARPERFPDDPAPGEDGLWHVDLNTGDSRLVLPIAALAANRPDDRFAGAQHWVNHAVFSPGGVRFTFLHRWRRPQDRTWFTRQYTARPDGSDLRLLWDTGMVSHFDWRDDRTMLAWVRTEQGANRFALRDVETGETTVVGEGVLTEDGHCSYSPDRRWVLNDTYPDKTRHQTLMLYRVADGRRFDLARLLEPPQFAGPFRCDLHPRWNRDGTQVCVDSTHDGTHRQVYVADVSDILTSA
jgi:hypothetical protein